MGQVGAWSVEARKGPFYCRRCEALAMVAIMTMLILTIALMLALFPNDPLPAQSPTNPLPSPTGPGP